MLPRPLPRLLAFASVALVLGCSGGSAADPVVLTGSSTLAPLMSSLAAAYEAEHPGLRIDVQSGGSGQGIRDARSGLAAFGMVSRSLAAGEEDLQAWPVARDGIGVVVHAERDLAGLDSATLRAVYRGEIRDWGELGGAPGAITVVHKADGRATRAVFLGHLGLEAREVQADIIAGENAQAIKTVAGDDRAIAYVSIGAALADREAGVPIRLLPLDGIEPTPAAVAAGQWPLARTLILVAPEMPTGPAADFLDFVRSEAATPFIRDDGFTPLPATP